MKIICVDDEPIICKGIQHLINSKEKMEVQVVYTYTDPEEALETCNWEEVDLLLIDINMPKVTGFDLIKALHELGYDILTIIISGYAEFDYAQQALRSHVVDFIVKPIVPDKLFSAINEARNQYLQRLQIRNSQQFLQDNLNTISYAFFEGLLFQTKDFSVENCLHMLSALGFEKSHFSVLEFLSKDIREFQLKTDMETIGTQLHTPMYCFSSGSGLHTILAISPCGETFQEKEFKKMLLRKHPDSLVSESLTTNNAGDLRNIHKKLLGQFPLLDADSRKNLSKQLKDENNVEDLGGSNFSEYSLPVQQVIKLIRESYTRPLSLTILSGELGIHPTYLSNLFSKQTGITLIDYLNRYRVKQAKKILEDPLSKICWVSERVGFADQRYFSQVFKKITGLTPVQYQTNYFILSNKINHTSDN